MRYHIICGSTTYPFQAPNTKSAIRKFFRFIAVTDLIHADDLTQMAIIIAVNANGKPTNKSASLFLVAPALYLLGIIDAESLFINLIKMYPLDMITPDNITRILESNAKLLN